MTHLKPAVDIMEKIMIQGTAQTIRIRAVKAGLPPLLYIQGGPGLPVLNEVKRLEEKMGLESFTTVAYWEQRGCGAAAPDDARSVSLKTQAEDLSLVISRLFAQFKQKILLFGISIGATLALHAAEENPSAVRAVVAVSPDIHTARADAAAHQAILRYGAARRRLFCRTRLNALGAPPYRDTKRFLARLRFLADMGGVEYGKKFRSLMGEMLLSLAATYGLRKIHRVLSNMNTVQERMLGQLSGIDLLSAWPRVPVPIHLVFGAEDPLNPPSLLLQVKKHIPAGSTVNILRRAGHLAHHDRPDDVRETVKQALHSLS